MDGTQETLMFEAARLGRLDGYSGVTRPQQLTGQLAKYQHIYTQAWKRALTADAAKQVTR